MSVLSKTITLRVPLNIIYRALIGITRKLVIYKENKELTIKTTTLESPIQISEKFRLIISGDTCTDVEYVTETNVGENNVVVQSIVQTHIANILYSLLMLETGYINGLMEKRE